MFQHFFSSRYPNIKSRLVPVLLFSILAVLALSFLAGPIPALAANGDGDPCCGPPSSAGQNIQGNCDAPLLCYCATCPTGDNPDEPAEGRAGVCRAATTIAVCGSDSNTLEEIVDAILRWVFIVSSVLAPLLILIGAFLIMTAQGDTSKVAKARQLITYTAIGYALVLGSKILYSFIMDLIGFK